MRGFHLGMIMRAALSSMLPWAPLMRPPITTRHPGSNRSRAALPLHRRSDRRWSKRYLLKGVRP
ncbi:hypothetical protein [Rhodopseudomonas sp. B29]|uniref:hypothetical protein n=1 Tax=Rhodopseudomonas sp. B29 TaxID=95607 RepID=UPI0003450A16|nr:hypothetical protein [Rhodopseudomonas sp. B29]